MNIVVYICLCFVFGYITKLLRERHTSVIEIIGENRRIMTINPSYSIGNTLKIVLTYHNNNLDISTSLHEPANDSANTAAAAAIVVNEGSKRFDDDGNGPAKSTNITTTIRRCCTNNDCRVLRYGETCSDSELMIKIQDKKQRPTPKSEKPKNKSYSYVSPWGFNGDNAVQFRHQVLDKSNFYRNKYGIASLILDEQLNDVAQDWANKLAKTGKLGHRPSNPYGENIYYTTELDGLGDKAVDAWFSEIYEFNPAENELELFVHSRIHHMTQLLWKSSSKLGVGISRNPNNLFKYAVVANYYPAGNVYGNFKNNLPILT